MKQLAPDRLWVLLSRKLGYNLSGDEADELAFLMADHEEGSMLLETLNNCNKPGSFPYDGRDAHAEHITRKSIFISMMKKIARDLEIAFTDFLSSDILSKNWHYKAGPDKWTKKEIIGHLIDSAQINLQRFIRSTYSENFKVTYDQAEWVYAQHYGDADIRELLELWRLLNKQIVRVLENYPPDRLEVQSDTGKTAASFHTVEFLARDYVNHLNHHLKAIELE
jgi:hypothetical protein